MCIRDSRNVVVNYMAQVLKQYFEDNAVQILEGQITPEMLSESVKQMFTASQLSLIHILMTVFL